MHGILDKAIEDLEVAVSRNTDNPQPYFDLGCVFSALGRREEAVDMLRAAVRLMPDSAVASYALCWELELLGRYEDALDVLRRYAKSNRNYQTYQHWGRIRGKQKKWKSAYASYTKALSMRKLNTGPPDFEPEQKYKHIMKMRWTVADMDPENPDSFFEMAALLSEAEWLEMAADVAGTGLLMRPKAGAYHVVGRVRESEIRMSEAIDAYKEAIKKLSSMASRSDMALFYESLVRLLYECGRRREVLRYGAEAISLKVASRKMRKYYKRVEKGFEQPDDDQVSAGWTASHYSGNLLKIPDPDVAAGFARMSGGTGSDPLPCGMIQHFGGNATPGAARSPAV